MHANAVTPETAKEVLHWRRQAEELRARLQEVNPHGPAGTEALAQGRELFAIGFSLRRLLPRTGKSDRAYWVKGEERDAYVEVT